MDKPTVQGLIDGGVMIDTVPGLTAALAAKQATATLAATVQAYTLDLFAAPVASVDFNGQTATNFRIEVYAGTPPGVGDGSIWIDSTA